MIFVPSVGGISHNPAEYTAPDDLVAGANVLLQVVLELAVVSRTLVVGAAQLGPVARHEPRARGRGAAVGLLRRGGGRGAASWWCSRSWR